MKKSILFLFVFLTISLQSNAQLQIDDFRGLKFGTHLEDVSFDRIPAPVLKREGRIAGNEVYSVVNDDLTIGTARLEKLNYHFDKAGNFVGVAFSGSAEYNEDIESVLHSRLGPPEDTRLYQWEVIRTWEDDEVSVIFREHRDMDFEVHIHSLRGLKEKIKANQNITDF
jgi:hypothetical protein